MARDRKRLGLHRPGAREAAELEIRHHVEERTDRLIEAGWDPEAARAEALRRFGDPDAYREELAGAARSHDGRTAMGETLASVARDARHALRGFARSPSFAATLVGTLAVGFGSAAAVFSVVDAVMLRPLPYDRPEELVEVGLQVEGRSVTVPFLPVDQLDPWLEGASAFLAAAAYYDHVSLVRTDGPDPELLGLQAVSHDLDDLLGVRPRLGRAFTPDDAGPGARVVLLTHAYWRRTGGDPGVVGSTLRLEDEPWTVVGVLPPDFKFPVGGTADGWIPFASDRTAAGAPVDRARVVGRLRDGVSLEGAQDRADALAASLTEERPTRLGWAARLGPVGEWRGNPDIRKGLWLLAGAVGLMLLVSLANGVNLLLVQSSVRAPELGVRRAIGASGGRLVRQVLTESVVLSVAAGLFAVCVAAAAVEAMRRVLPGELDFSSVYDFGLEGRALLFVFFLAAGAGLAVGLPPALRAGLARPAGGGREQGEGRPAVRLRGMVVVAELALSVALLAGAGLFLSSFARMLSVDPGLDVDRLALVEMSLSERVYPGAVERRQFLDRLVGALERIDGVAGVAMADGLPPSGGGLTFGTGFQGEGREPMEDFVMLPYATVDPGTGGVLGLRMREGRAFEPGDAGRDLAIVDRDFARALFGDGSAVGRRFRLSGTGDWREVVGVVEDLKLSGLDDRRSTWAALFPLGPEAGPEHPSLAIRTAGDPRQLLPAIRAAIREVDPGQPVRSLQTARRAMAESVEVPRFLALLMTALSALAAVLAAVGIFGVLSYAVARRRREMGIRVALGAPAARVRGLVLRSGLALAGLGAVLGVGLSLLLSRFARGLLYGVEPDDPVAVGGAAVLMVAAAGLACWLPARRATRVDPVEVLREE